MSQNSPTPAPSKDPLKDQIDNTMSEFFDGYMLVGIVAGSDRIVCTTKWKDRGDRHKIFCGAVNLVNTAAV